MMPRQQRLEISADQQFLRSICNNLTLHLTFFLHLFWKFNNFQVSKILIRFHIHVISSISTIPTLHMNSSYSKLQVCNGRCMFIFNIWSSFTQFCQNKQTSYSSRCENIRLKILWALLSASLKAVVLNWGYTYPLGYQTPQQGVRSTNIFRHTRPENFKDVLSIVVSELCQKPNLESRPVQSFL